MDHLRVPLSGDEDLRALVVASSDDDGSFLRVVVHKALHPVHDVTVNDIIVVHVGVRPIFRARPLLRLGAVAAPFPFLVLLLVLFNDFAVLVEDDERLRLPLGRARF